LTIHSATDIGTPLLNVRILCVAEFFFAQSDERSRVDSVKEFLIV